MSGGACGYMSACRAASTTSASDRNVLSRPYRTETDSSFTENTKAYTKNKHTPMTLINIYRKIAAKIIKVTACELWFFVLLRQNQFKMKKEAIEEMLK